MQAVLSLGLGYFIGCINPAAWISRKKKVNLKEEGTGNLGATNTALVLGKIARALFPKIALVAGLMAGIGVLLGHCFPVTMHFIGGKGLASFGGLVLAHNPGLFVVLLIGGLTFAYIMDYGVYLAVFASTLFPITSFLVTRDYSDFLLTAIAGGLIFVMHLGNLKRAITHEDPIRAKTGLKKIFGEKK